MPGVLFLDDANVGDTVTLLRSDRSFQDCLVQDVGAIGVSSFNARIGAVIPLFGDYETSIIEDDSGLVPPGQVVSQTVFALATPFPHTYFLNPAASANLQKGSDSFPYRSFAFAFTDIASQGITNFQIVCPIGSVITENITIPDGVQCEICTLGTGKVSIVGNIVCTTVAQTVLRLTNVALTGTLSGVASSGGGNFLWATNSNVSGAVNMTGSGGGFWWAICQGLGTTFFGFGGGFASTTNIVGALFAFNFGFTGALSGITQFELNNCRLPVSVSIGGIGGNLVNCIPGNATTITGVGGTIPIEIDGITYKRIIQSGGSLVSLAHKTLMSNASNRRTVNGNLGSTSFTGAGGLVPNALYRASWTLEQTTPGTLGTALPEIRYSNLAGTALIEPIGAASGGLGVGLLVTAAAGTIARGELLFRPNGLGTPTFSLGGVTTAGAFAAELIISYQRVD